MNNIKFRVTNIGDAGAGRVNVSLQQIPEADASPMPGVSNLMLHMGAEEATTEGFFPHAEYEMALTKL
jgi:hypothetical protein